MTAPTNRFLPLGQILSAVALVVFGASAVGCADETPKPADETKASRVTIQAKGIRLDEALRRLQEQTGNPITDKRRPLDAEAANPALDLDLKSVPFLEALDEIARRAGVGLTFYTEDGSIWITGGEPPTTDYVAYSGPFRFQLLLFSARRDFQTGSAIAWADVEASWEPRLRPMLLSKKSANQEVRDDQGRVVPPRVPNESADYAVVPKRPSITFGLGMMAPERSAARLAILKARADATLPVDPKTFRFPSLAKANVEQKQGNIVATLVKVEADQHLWKVVIDLSYSEGGLVFESFRRGLFDNRIWLEKADGSRFELNGGFSATGEAEGRPRFEYLFLNAPGKIDDYQLVYEAPSRVIVAPFEFEFRNIPLP